jgi:exopolysaccharide production protein ExoQ
MTTTGHILHSNPNTDTTTISRQAFRTPLQLIAGFFFAYKFGFTYLGFQSDPRTGSIAALVCSGLILLASIIYTLGDDQFSIRFLFASRTLRWLAAYLVVSGLSLLWTAAESILDATALWTGMFMEVAIILLLTKRPNVTGQVDALLKGFVAGMVCIGAVAWIAPTLPDLRIGDYEFLHPNIIGMYSAMAFFLAQYLALKAHAWRWCCLFLGMTMLRTISKTSIVAFFIAESFYLLRERQITRALKIKIAAVALVVIAAFATLLESYFELYSTSGSGTQVETLTGRTVVWAAAFSIAIEKPWIGHGFYSLRALIPAIGDFEAWHAHNELLQEFFEYGLLGVAITVGLYLALIFTAKRYAAKHGSESPYVRLIFVIVLFAMIHGLTESINFGLSIPLWLFATFAIALEQPPSEATT